MDEDEFDFKNLDKVIKALTKNIPELRIGIAGSKDKRKEDESTNAEIGARHEFGSGGMPVRSFLRMPLVEKLQGALTESNAFTEDTLKKVIRTGTIREWMSKIGIVGEGVIQDAFATGGFGKWKPSDMSRKTVHMTLVESQQLRDSIISEVSD